VPYFVCDFLVCRNCVIQYFVDFSHFYTKINLSYFFFYLLLEHIFLVESNVIDTVNYE
jgi:hypothetical protein